MRESFVIFVLTSVKILMQMKYIHSACSFRVHFVHDFYDIWFDSFSNGRIVTRPDFYGRLYW
jgi:hypothetical protein